jgi:hypothetical protein
MKKVYGYRELTENELETINSIKQTAEEVGEIIDGMAGWSGADQRWLAIAKTDLQKGFMSLVRAVARPDSF